MIGLPAGHRSAGLCRGRTAVSGGLVLALGLVLGPGCHRPSSTPEAEQENPSLLHEGKGLKLPAETQSSLGVQIGAAGPQTLRPTQVWPVQVFHRATNTDGTVCLRASGFIPSSLATRVEGARVTARLESQAQASLEGRVLRVEASAGPGLGQAELLVELCGASASAVGSFAEVQVELGPVHAACAVPRGALVRAALGDFVYVVADGFFKRVRVKVGVEDAAWAEVQSGLAPGTPVVAAGAHALWLLELSEVGGMANLR